MLTDNLSVIIKRYVAWAVWLGVIFYFSSLNGPAEHYAYSLRVYIERKGAHIFEYLVLFILTLRFFRLSSRNNLFLYGWAFIFSLFYAVTDEFHQLFVFGREGRLWDVGFDAAGIFLGMVIYAYFHKRKQRQKLKP